MAMATDPELQWVSLWLRVRWAAVLVLLLSSLVMLLLPLDNQCQAVLKGLSLLRNKLGSSSGISRLTGQSTELSVTSRGLELLVLKGKASPGERCWVGRAEFLGLRRCWRGSSRGHRGDLGSGGSL